jgi:hypothetical protein
MRTGNLVASFSSEGDALALVRDAIHAHGEAYASNLALVREDEAGHAAAVAEGSGLVERARPCLANHWC